MQKINQTSINVEIEGFNKTTPAATEVDK
jgi:hypothetical protein